ncbi:MAG: LPS export ABC transporter periplasmic protein LptC [Verrucomicrobiota bacterium]
MNLRPSILKWLGVLVASGLLWSKAPVKSEEAAQILSATLPQELTQMFPVGREFRGVVFPSYSEDTLSSVMTAGSILRVDERYMELTDLVITVYKDGKTADTTIKMDEAIYDLVSATLESRTPAAIEQEQFTMTGDVMTFETPTQISRLRGNVRLVVPDAGGFTPNFGFDGTKPNDSE